MSRPLHRRLRVQRAVLVGLTSLVTLSSCTTLGGNVRGSFSCTAPDGICGPSATIDDRALALISGGDGGESHLLAGIPNRSAGHPGVNMANLASVRAAPSDPGRSQEKVLRIVFQPYIDARGRLHEAGAVHAVVASGDWAPGPASVLDGQRSAIPPALMGGAESLAAAVDRVDPPVTRALDGDATLPDPAAIEAARARKADPVAAIKADVSSRLAAERHRGGVKPPISSPAPALVPVIAMPSRTATAAIGRAQDVVSGTGAEAVTRGKATPGIRAIRDGAAAKTTYDAPVNGAMPGASPGPDKTVRAASFPAAVPEDN